MKKAAFVFALTALLGGAGLAQESKPPIMVQLADGSTLALTAWALVYEYGAWEPGSTPAFAKIERPESNDLWVGKKKHATAGAKLEIRYRTVTRQREQEDGRTVEVEIPVATALILTTPKGRQEMKPEAPQRELLVEDKTLNVQPRTLDLIGLTLTGTKRQICLVSYSALAECVPDPGQQVVLIQFPN